MRIVLDTKVLVSGLLSPFGAPGQIVRMAAAGALSVCFDARIVAEYEEVLARPRFGFDPQPVRALLDYLVAHGEVTAGLPLSASLPDHDDEPFLEVAIAGRAESLVTGNVAHFPLEAPAGICVLTPAGFLEFYRGQGPD